MQDLHNTSYLPRAEPSTRPGGVSRSRTEPWQPRAERPGGWLNPHARKGVSTFGNTGKHRPAPDPDRATGLLPYPRATSNVIITMKPRAKVRTPISECSPSDISGISSSTTTYIMAPAAKERR